MDQIVIYETENGESQIDVRMENDTVWLSQQQMAALFQTDRTSILRHIKHIYKTHELEEEPTCAFFAQVRQEGTRTIERQIPYYNLDMIISVGYRVNSIRGTQFRIWANRVLKNYLVRGYAANQRRLAELNQAIQLMQRTRGLEAAQVLSVVERYTRALNLLDDYDHQRVDKPEGTKSGHVLSADECREFIKTMRFASESELFGNEKDASFEASLGAIYQTFGGQDVYPTIQEKAANLLYFITKNHSFSDGNKRIAAALFLYFLDKNGLLLRGDGQKRISDNTLVAITLMIAESRPQEKELMVNIVMHFLA